MDPKTVAASVLSLLDQVANAHEDAQDPAFARVEHSAEFKTAALPRPAQVTLAQARAIRTRLKERLAADPQVGLDLALRVADFVRGIASVAGVPA